MSGCRGLHCEGCGHGSVLLAVLLAAAGAAAAAIAAVAEDLLLAAGTAVLAVLASVAAFTVRAWRRGWRPSLDPVVAWNPHTALPDPQARQALPAVPQQLHIHLHGLDAGQAADVIRHQITEGR